ncbi:histidine kinase [Marivirga arenosa]|uniref:Histidine kinase n=1 Tax=Marivirga arenosa TaxID=3059076 RepID=A0AA51RDU5_9BACT|nr:histidine kinase [Marivirga sp. ABR2-2]WMN07805.1 histidine kinase [Marivirga sp. ABR2-2]
MKKQHHTLISRKTIGHIIFWCVMLIYYISSAWPHESDKVFLFERMFSKTSVQIILSYLFIYLLIPLFIDKKRRVVFTILSLLAIYNAYVMHTAIRCFYLLPKYPEVYRYRPPLEFVERITNVYAFIGSITELIFPAIILIVIDYYRKQKELISLKEQKRSTELRLLKHQLNPHFLFNTLNNLYSLSLKKSERTPEVIEKLSDILDYILYKCDANYVSIANEVKLIDNYISLEKVRYGKRLNIKFDYEVKEEFKIAPLLLLTLVENAFKHGVKQEIKIASIDIQLRIKGEEIIFMIENTKPDIKTKESKKQRPSIGLRNIEKQLQLLYPQNQYKLKIEESTKSYKVNLNLFANGI